ncbi:hypothetical protein [Streptomyces sp. NPDC096311]|uniref:hypothetical protein n=1 Tax=Streptomyces sp. NPDC096311 TaxID=3366083 RepID=UPI003802FE4C
MSVMTGAQPMQQFGQQTAGPQQLAQVVQQSIQQACQQASQQIAQRMQQTLQQIQQVQQQLEQQGIPQQHAHPYLAVALHTTLLQGVRGAVEQSVQQALPTAILTLLQQSQQGQHGQHGQQQWGGGYGQQQFGQQFPQFQQPGFGYGQMTQPFGIG